MNHNDRDDLIVGLVPTIKIRDFENMYSGHIGDLKDKIMLGAYKRYEDTWVPAGLLVCDVNTEDGEVLFIEWIYVHPHFRQDGIFTAMMKKLLDTVKSSPIIRYICASYPSGESFFDNVFDKLGFGIEEDENFNSIRVDLADLQSDRIPNVDTKGMVEIGKVDRKSFLRLENKVADEDIPCGITFPVEPGKYMRDSFALMNGSEVEGIMFFANEGAAQGKTLISIPWLYSSDRSGKTLIKMFAYAAKHLKEEYGDDLLIEYGTLTKEIVGISSKLFKKVTCKGIKVAVADRDSLLV